LLAFNFEGFLFIQIAELLDLGMAEQRVIVEVQLRIQRIKTCRPR
jgi:hypothetical protein